VAVPEARHRLVQAGVLERDGGMSVAFMPARPGPR
jgi:hypothetical protein